MSKAHRVATSAALARQAIGESPASDAARDEIASRCASADIRSASILPLYLARGRGEVGGFSVPAVNIRGLTFDVALAIFEAMRVADCAAAVFEINRAEVGFTAQRPAEFASQVMAAALAAGWRGPVFLQLDHLMANAKAYHEDPGAETKALEDLVVESIAAGFGNIDLDASTLVDLSFDSVPGQQRANIAVTAHLARLIRANEGPGGRISVGGEIGEVGSHNSTVEELTAFVDGFLAVTAGEDIGGLSKVSVQTGTRHGGVLLPDGSTADVALDFATLETLSAVCRTHYGMAGAVQHGASTLPDVLFRRFPEVECAEIHLATGFQNAVLDHPRFPAMLRDEMHTWTLHALAAEREPGETDPQFIRRARRKAWGPFKQHCLDIPPDARASIREELSASFVRLFNQLNVIGTRSLVDRHIALPAGDR